MMIRFCNDINYTIRKRRSVRTFKEKKIPKKIIRRLLYSAMYAPSPKNKQPWKFLVFTENKKSDIVKVFKKRLEYLQHKDQRKYIMEMETVKALEEAPVFILICYDEECHKVYHNDGKLWGLVSPQSECCDIQAIGAAIQNLVLMAHYKGISSLWICDILYAYDEIKTIVGINDTFIAGVALGYSNNKPVMPKRNFDKIFWY